MSMVCNLTITSARKVKWDERSRQLWSKMLFGIFISVLAFLIILFYLFWSSVIPESFKLTIAAKLVTIYLLTQKYPNWTFVTTVYGGLYYLSKRVLLICYLRVCLLLIFFFVFALGKKPIPVYIIIETRLWLFQVLDWRGYWQSIEQAKYPWKHLTIIS